MIAVFGLMTYATSTIPAIVGLGIYGSISILLSGVMTFTLLPAVMHITFYNRTPRGYEWLSRSIFWSKTDGSTSKAGCASLLRGNFVGCRGWGI